MSKRGQVNKQVIVVAVVLLTLFTVIFITIPRFTGFTKGFFGSLGVGGCDDINVMFNKFELLLSDGELKKADDMIALIGRCYPNDVRNSELSRYKKAKADLEAKRR